MRSKLLFHRVTLAALALLLPYCTDAESGGTTIGPPFGGSLCAFADVNLDRFTDLVVRKSEREIVFQFASSDTLRKSTIPDFSPRGGINVTASVVPDGKTIIECAAADFDGDGRIDVLVTAGASADQPDTMVVCFGVEEEKFLCSSDYTFTDLAGYPSIIDYDVDGRHDLVYRRAGKTDRLTCVYGIDRQKKPAAKGQDCFVFEGGNGTALWDGFVNAYVDILNASDGRALPTDQHQDLSAEFIVGVKDASGNPNLHIWQKVERASAGNAGWKMARATGTPKDLATVLLDSTKGLKRFGRLVAADFDADGMMDLMLPACKSDTCDEDELTLMLWTGNEQTWLPLKLLLSDMEGGSKQDWRVIMDDTGSFALRAGDADMDGYPDVLVSLKSTGGKSVQQRAFVVANKPCAESGCPWPRRFAVKFGLMALDSLPPEGSDLVLATFFDLFEDGILDVVYEYKDRSSGSSNFRFIAAEATGDTTFLKAEVYTPMSKGGADDMGEKAIAHYGATLGYSMVKDTDLDLLRGDKIRGVHTQLSQVSGRALQLPFVIFGLGRSPNFVEELAVGIPSMPRRWHSFSQIVPNSRLFVVPNLSNDDWLGRLYVTPSRLVLLSFAALCAICAACLFVIVLLWYREYKVDEREKQAQTHRFHFDAM